MDKRLDLKKVYKENLIWWIREISKEIHHIFGRVGILKICPLLWINLSKAEHQDYKLRARLREERLLMKKQVEENFVKYLGCKRYIYPTCNICKMPLIFTKRKILKKQQSRWGQDWLEQEKAMDKWLNKIAKEKEPE